jgi:Flp pilus assembly CpaF family ATPase
MKVWYNNVIDSDRKLVEVQGNRIRIGRARHNEIVLESPYVAAEAAVLYRRSGKWELVVLGMNGAQVGDKRLYNGSRCEIQGDQAIGLFPFSLTLDLPKAAEVSVDQERLELDRLMSRFIADMHVSLLKRTELKLDNASVNKNNDEYLLSLERCLENIAVAHPLIAKDTHGLIDQVSGHAVRDFVLSKQSPVGEEGALSALCKTRHWSRLVSAVPERELELESTASYLFDELNKAEHATEPEQADWIKRIENGFWKAWQKIAPHVHREFKQYLTMRYLKKEIKDIVFGYGPLEDLLRLPAVSEIMVVDRDHIFIERNGVLENSGRRFISDEVIEAIIQRIVAAVGRRIDKSQPLVDARLSDGSRVNAIIPPLAVSGPSITIRKFPYKKLLVDDLVQKGSLTRTVAEFLRAIVLHRQNILISGGTGTGKTTLLNCLSDFIPDNERIVTVEDTAELQLAKEHVVRLETKDANIEGTGEYTIRDLVRNSLRMRPDRIVVGECRGPEALDMLQAMNTGHDGSLTTIHANDAHDVIHRLEVLVQMAADLPVESIRQQVASAINIIVQLKRMRDGRRCVSQITEITGIDAKSGKLELRDLYLMNPEEGQLQATGRLPTFIDELVSSGHLQLDSFYCS